ncbi:MAG TPA: LptF/LptG family permease [Bryobacteraceae bacterium]|nr:LptF/LptG family permease [Bryobacteraceae bacterium]
MRLLSRTIFREIFVSASLGAALFTFILFLQRARPLFEFLVRSPGPPSQVLYLFALVLPQALPFTVPLGVLVATLITVSRMSSDGEITAMRAAGVPGRSVVLPILTFGFLAMWVAAAASLWLTPWSIRERYRVENLLVAGGLTADVQPRVFDEQYPNTVLYVTDVTTGSTGRWKRIFLADVTPPENRLPSATERGDSPRITLASEALVAPDAVENRLQLSLQNGSTYEAGKEPGDYHITMFPAGDQILQARKPEEIRASRVAPEMDTLPLYRRGYQDASLDRTALLDARMELNQRFALPLACVLMTLIGIPLGITRRRAGKSAAVVMTVAIAFLYYMAMIGFIGLARQGAMPAEVAVWLPDVLLTLFGVVMIAGLERPGDRDLLGTLSARLQALRATRGGAFPERGRQVLERLEPKRVLARFSLLPQVIDAMVLSSFLFYFLVLLVSFVMMTHVFTFFELLSDIVKNHISMSRVLTYHLFLTPRLIYDLTPVGVLTAVLVTFGVLTKNNEVTAVKACGISVYRLTAPVLLAGCFLSGSLFAFDHYWVPEADRRQDAIRAEIKGRPAQTFLRPDRRWIYGLRDRVYYYRYFDSSAQVMLGVNVYEIDPDRFRIKRHIFAERAKWDRDSKAWVFENGWSRDMTASNVTRFDDFSGGTRTFLELEEPPDYFVKEVKQSRQMNFRELAAYIGELQQSGFDTVALQVQFYKKFSVPLFALILAMVSIPFAFLAGNRGAMAGVGMSLAIFILYWSIGQVFEQVGNLSQLPAQVAAWSPDVIFSLAGFYFLARMRT